MRIKSMSERELRLLAVFVVLVVSVSFYFLWEYWDEERDRLSRMHKKLTGELEVSELLLSEQAYWRVRKNWVDQHQPKVKSANLATSDLLATMEGLAKQHGVTINEQRTEEPKDLSGNYEISVRFQVRGREEGLFKWMHEVQSPERFRYFKEVELKTGTEKGELECHVMVAQICRVVNVGVK